MYTYFDTGEPIAWCISDRETTEVIEVLFRCMKERSPGVEVNILMTDDGALCMLHTIYRQYRQYKTGQLYIYMYSVPV